MVNIVAFQAAARSSILLERILCFCASPGVGSSDATAVNDIGKVSPGWHGCLLVTAGLLGPRMSVHTTGVQAQEQAVAMKDTRDSTVEAGTGIGHAYLAALDGLPTLQYT